MGEQGQKGERVGVSGGRRTKERVGVSRETRTERGTGEYKWWNKDRKRKGVLLGKQGQNGERVGVIGEEGQKGERVGVSSGGRTERGTGRR